MERKGLVTKIIDWIECLASNCSWNFLELKGVEISEHEIKAEIKVLDSLEGDASISVEF